MDSSAARVSGRAAPRVSVDPPENRVAERALALARVLLSVAANDTTQGTWLYVGNNNALANTFNLHDFGATDYFNLVINTADAGDTLQEVADSMAYVLGPKVDAFEERFAAYTGARHCIGVNSGTSALHLALTVTGVE